MSKLTRWEGGGGGVSQRQTEAHTDRRETGRE